MVALIIAFPGIVTGGLAKKATIDTNKIQIEVPAEESTTSPSTGEKTDSEQEDAQKAFDRASGKPEPGK
jgi:hypothetical protein